MFLDKRLVLKYHFVNKILGGKKCNAYLRNRFRLIAPNPIGAASL